MPELPEVETVVRELKGSIEHKTIRSCKILRDSYLRGGNPSEFVKRVTGRIIKSVKRRGKYILWDLGDGGVMSHLGMTGKYIRIEKDSEYPKHTVAAFGFDDFEVIFNDVRRFGRLKLFELDNLPEEVRKLGAEPFSDGFTTKYLHDKFQNRKRAVKEVLLDQAIIAGLGNIYVSEILFRARIHPLKQAGKISRKKLAEVVKHTREILTKAIEHNGTTISDYKRVDEKSGEFQNFLAVYGKQGDACKNCGTEIEKVVIGGRSSFYCRKCQKGAGT